MSQARVELHLVPALGAPASEAQLDDGNLVLRGQLGMVSVVDIIQLISTRGRSWRIFVFDQAVDVTVTIVNGELVDARWGSKSGHEALVEIVGTCVGTFEVQPFVDTGERSLFGHWQGNIVSAVQRLDERVRTESGVTAAAKDVRGETPRSKPLRSKSGKYDFEAILSDNAFDLPEDTSTRPELGIVNSTDVLELTDLGFMALRAGNVEQAKAHWAKALEIDPANRTLRFNLKKLQGYDREY